MVIIPSALDAYGCQRLKIKAVESIYHPNRPLYHILSKLEAEWEHQWRLLSDKNFTYPTRRNNQIAPFHLSSDNEERHRCPSRVWIGRVSGDYADDYVDDDESDVDPRDAYDFLSDGLKCVPWGKKEDGTFLDMWNMVRDIYRHEDKSYRCTRFFCIDRQPDEDNTVIVVEAITYPPGKAVQAKGSLLQDIPGLSLRGFRYRRVFRGQTVSFASKRDTRTIYEYPKRSSSRRDIVGPTHTFIRPDWPDAWALSQEAERD